MTTTVARTAITKENVRSLLSVVELTEVTRDKAVKVAAMFEAALGPKGIQSPGHEAYPDPSLYTADGIVETVESPYRRLFIAEMDGAVLGGIIGDALHEYAVEFNCMAVDRRYRGFGIGSVLVEGAKRVFDNAFFVSNVTELVTHNLASQTAHIKHGYKRFLGFGYSHYPHVFFSDHPESVVWAGQLQGRLVRELENLRGRIGRLDNLSDDEILDLIACQSRQVVGKASIGEKQIATELVKARFVFLPQRYVDLGRDILKQYSDHLDYRINEEMKSETCSESRFHVDFKPDYAHTYIDFDSGFDLDEHKKELTAELERIKTSPGKRFIKASIKANHPSAVNIAEFLQSQGFLFHSILPLYQYEKSECGGKHKFHDLLGMQWIAQDAISKNPLPGETGSVIKVYGYPANLTGNIIGLIAEELNDAAK